MARPYPERVRRNATPPKNANFPTPLPRAERARFIGEPTIKTLDAGTLVFTAALIYGVLAGVMIFYAAVQRSYPGFKDWIFLALGLTGALVIIMTYPAGRPPAWPLVVVVNVLLVLSADRLHRGMARFAGEPAGATAIELGLYAAGAAAFLWFLLQDPHYAARLTVVALCMALATWRAAAVALRLARGRYGAAGWLVVTVLGLGVVVLLVRAAAVLLAASPVEFMRRTGPETALLAVLIAYGMSMMVSLLLLTAQRAQLELGEAQAQVQRLEGIIPICMYCHKVRNDQAAWDRIETYISNHSQARFSHGICPDCLPRHFPPELLEDQAS
jgi:hypothetical protein